MENNHENKINDIKEIIEIFGKWNNILTAKMEELENWIRKMEGQFEEVKKIKKEYEFLKYIDTLFNLEDETNLSSLKKRFALVLKKILEE